MSTASAGVPPAHPLRGRTVVVTRAGPRAGPWADALARVGARLVELPLTEQVDPADGGAALRAAAGTVGACAWVVVTSVHAVERLLAALGDSGELATVQVAAVGPATADALRRVGVEPRLVPTEHNARGLVAAFPDAPAAGASRRVLFPCADLAPDTVPEGLRAKGWEVRRVEAYRTVAGPPPGAALVDEVVRADALVLTAASAARAFLALRTADGAPVPPPAHVVCIGAATADAARQAGMAGVTEASQPSPEGIVAELEARLGSGAGSAS